MSLFKNSISIPKEKRLFTNKQLVLFLIPMFLQQILNVMVGAVDTMMVSSAGEAAVSGVSLISTLDGVLIIFFTAMIGGGSVVIAQKLGEKNQKDVSESVKQLLYVATALAVILTITVEILRGPMLSLLFGEAEAAVMNSANEYFMFVALSFPLVAIAESLGASFRSSGHTFISLIVSIIANLVNVCGNAILIYGFGMGAAGAAIATIIARAVSSTILITLILNKKYEVHIEKILKYKPDFAIIKKIMGIGIPNGIENTMFQFGRLITQTLIALLPTAMIAANAVSLTICNFQYMTGTACSIVMITVVGRCIGAGDLEQAKYYSRKLLLINYLVLWGVILLTLVFLFPLVSAYGLSGESAEMARNLIILHSIVAALIWPIGFMLPSAFRAAGDVRFPMIVSSLSMWIMRVMLAYFFALPSVSVFGLFSLPGLNLGITGVWIAMFSDWVVRVGIYIWRYFSGAWLKSHKKQKKTSE